MKVLLKANERTQNNGACKIVEIDKYLIINGLIHERQNLKPTNRYCITPTGDSRDANSAMPSLNQVAMLCNPTLKAQDYRDGCIYGTEMVDSEDPTIIYKLFPSYYNGDKRIAKYKKLDNNEIELLIDKAYAEHSSVHRFIGQNKDFIFTVWQRTYNDGSNNGMNYVSRFDKATLGRTDNHFAREKLYPIFETPIKSYVMTDNIDNSYSLGYFMKDTWAWVRVGTFDVAGGGGSPSWTRQRPLTGFQIDDSRFGYFFAFDGEGSVRPRRNTPCICKGVVNIANDAVQFVEQNINFDRCSRPISDLNKIPDVSTWYRYTNLKLFTLNNKKYLVLSHVHDWDITTELTDDTAWFYLFEVDDINNTLYCLDAQRTNPRMQHLLYGEDGRHLCFANFSQVKVFSLDENTMTYKASFNKYFGGGEQIQYFGLDKDNTMWIQGQWQSLYMERIPYNFELVADYDKNTLVFSEGETEKLVNIKIGYRDYYKNYKSKKVKITLDHPNNQLFSSNDSHIITVDTLNNGMLSIPVKVFKPGYLKFDVEFV